MRLMGLSKEKEQESKAQKDISSECDSGQALTPEQLDALTAEEKNDTSPVPVEKNKESSEDDTAEPIIFQGDQVVDVEHSTQCASPSPEALNVSTFKAMYKAIMVYPGFQDQQQAILAVREITRKSLELEERVMQASDSVTSMDRVFFVEVVSNEWVNQLFTHQGATTFPDINVASIASAMIESSEMGTEAGTALNHSVHTAFLRMTSNMMIHLNRHQQFIEAATEGKVKVDVKWCITEIVSSLKDSVTSLTRTTSFDNDECHAMLYQSASEFFDGVWSNWRGRMFESIKAMQSPQDAQQYMMQDHFQQGFPVEAIRRDLHDGLRQLVNSAQHVMSMSNKKGS